jgi:hypothetical protein
MAQLESIFAEGFTYFSDVTKRTVRGQKWVTLRNDICLLSEHFDHSASAACQQLLRRRSHIALAKAAQNITSYRLLDGSSITTVGPDD